jgi:hypothetical protein
MPISMSAAFSTASLLPRVVGIGAMQLTIPLSHDSVRRLHTTRSTREQVSPKNEHPPLHISAFLNALGVVEQLPLKYGNDATISLTAP